jgi:hypothetical protein
MVQPVKYPHGQPAPKRVRMPRTWDLAVRILIVVGILIGLIGRAFSRDHLLFDWIGLCVVLMAAVLYLVARFHQREIGSAD